jgi:cob(I)alamin adenosyltransferase
MSIFRGEPGRCIPIPEENFHKQALAPIEEQIKAVSAMINGLRERVAELSAECNARIGACAARVREMERRLDKITGPLESMHSDELQRILYILELIKKGQQFSTSWSASNKDQEQKRKARRVI